MEELHKFITHAFALPRRKNKTDRPKERETNGSGENYMRTEQNQETSDYKGEINVNNVAASGVGETEAFPRYPPRLRRTSSTVSDDTVDVIGDDSLPTSHEEAHCRTELCESG